MIEPEVRTALQEADAIRSYLQRAEVRLSTMHRVAGVFLNGAGLLVLFPFFFKDAILTILGALREPFVLRSQLLLYVAAFAALALPVYALYLLVKDIALFYFAPHELVVHRKQLPARWFMPQFVLTGFAVASDEAPSAKGRIQEAIESSEDIQRLVVPPDQAKRRYLSGLYDDTDGAIIPERRQGSAGKTQGAILSNVALGLAGCNDTTLAEQAGEMEIMLARHAINLRRLVLRYAKALLLFIWTTLVGLILGWLLGERIHGSRPTQGDVFIAAWGFMVWALLTPPLVKRPIRWIYGLADQNTERHGMRSDHALVLFESIVLLACAITIGALLGVFALNLQLVGWILLPLGMSLIFALWYAVAGVRCLVPVLAARGHS